MVPSLAIVVPVVGLVGTSLSLFIEVTTSIVLAFRRGISWLICAPDSNATEPIVTAKA